MLFRRAYRVWIWILGLAIVLLGASFVFLAVAVNLVVISIFVVLVGLFLWAVRLSQKLHRQIHGVERVGRGKKR